MIILGCDFWSGLHDASAALVIDGRLHAAAEQERFSRTKHDGGVPMEAIEYCLRSAGIGLADVDVVAFPSRPFRSGPDSEMAEVDASTLRRLHKAGAVRRRAFVHKRVMDLLLRSGIARNLGMNAGVAAGFAAVRERFGPLPPVRFYGHHQSHAAVAYLTSPFDEATVITVDGRGGPYAALVSHARSANLVPVRGEPYTNSLGRYYEDCTRYLGLGAFGEGKAMGLASYGDARRYGSATARMLERPPEACYRYRHRPSPELLGFVPRTTEPILDAAYTDFAAAVQAALEETMQRMARWAITATGSDRLAMSGGVLLNCSSNGRMAEQGVGSSRWVFAAAGDGGLSVGAALLCAAELGVLEREVIEHAYWGPEYSDADHEAAIRAERRVRGKRHADIEAKTAAIVAEGRVVGWHQGRMELGPRALGNRSILADPRSVEMRDKVNRIKGREPWRPLAPVVPAERAGEYFTLAEPSPFMLFASAVRPSMRSRIPAVVHVDGSARPQTVTRAQNGRLHRLLREFEAITGTPVLLNTSFNDADEPIVCSPADAIATFLRTELDVLVLGNHLVERAAGDASP